MTLTKERGADKFGETRDSIMGKLEIILLATLLWGLFKAIIYSVLDQFEIIEKDMIEKTKDNIEINIISFFEKRYSWTLDTLKMSEQQKNLSSWFD